MRFFWKGVLIMAIVSSVAGVSSAENWKDQPGTYAVFDTSMGKVVCRLFPDKAPKTVANFTGLAEGTKEFKDAKTGAMVKRPFYDGLIFHRVIPNFMIQGGCPLGQGYGGPGYTFEDEIVPGLGFSKPGLLAMANSGAGTNTNGSQFFITVSTPDYLDGHHTIFGEVVEGYDVAVKIANTPRSGQDRPVTPVVINKLTIQRNK